jgi:hypothetical protein
MIRSVLEFLSGEREFRYLSFLNKCDHKKYKKLDRALITKFDKKLLQNNNFCINYKDEHQ